MDWSCVRAKFCLLWDIGKNRGPEISGKQVNGIVNDIVNGTESQMKVQTIERNVNGEEMEFVCDSLEIVFLGRTYQTIDEQILMGEH